MKLCFMFDYNGSLRPKDAAAAIYELKWPEKTLCKD